MLSLLLSYTLLFTPPATDTSGLKQRTISTVNQTEILGLVNEVRKKGCQCGDTFYPAAPALVWNSKLEKAALDHSNDMLQYNYFSHTSRHGGNAGKRIEAAGYHWKTYGENLAVGFDTATEVIKGWLKSAGHCKNLMDKNFREMGVAKAGKYWTQAFATR